MGDMQSIAFWSLVTVATVFGLYVAFVLYSFSRAAFLHRKLASRMTLRSRRYIQVVQLRQELNSYRTLVKELSR